VIQKWQGVEEKIIEAGKGKREDLENGRGLSGPGGGDENH
jgi:hypothetical protein